MLRIKRKIFEEEVFSEKSEMIRSHADEISRLHTDFEQKFANLEECHNVAIAAEVERTRAAMSEVRL